MVEATIQTSSKLLAASLASKARLAMSADPKLKTAPNQQQRRSIEVREIPLVKLSLENVSYAPLLPGVQQDSAAKKKRVQVLRNITTEISPFKLTAWMGPSGSKSGSVIQLID